MKKSKQNRYIKRLESFQKILEEMGKDEDLGVERYKCTNQAKVAAVQLEVLVRLKAIQQGGN